MRGLKEISLKEALKGIEEARKDRVNKYSLVEILFVALVTILCGAETFSQMKMMADSMEKWLKEFLPYDNGIPSAATLRRVLGAIKPESVHKVFIEWMSATLEAMKADQDVKNMLALDGKTIRGSKTKNKRPSHIVSAYASAISLVIGQIACEEKSNEITAIPELLSMLDIKKLTITVDAMGAQRAIAECIDTQEGFYLLQVKGSQKFLHQALKDAFAACLESEEIPEGIDYFKFESEKKQHGREKEIRECWVIKGTEWMGGTAEKWPSVKYGAVIRSKVTENGKTKTSTHYFIGNQEDASAEEVLAAKRAHWGVESFHWVLDVQLGDDACKVHADHAAENLNALRQIIYNVLRVMKHLKGGFSTKQLQCLLDEKKRTEAMAELGFVPNRKSCS